MQLTELLKSIAQALVDNPDEVVVTELESTQTSIFELQVAKSDIGKVIGRQGRTAQALRTILTAASAKLHKRATLEILDLES